MRSLDLHLVPGIEQQGDRPGPQRGAKLTQGVANLSDAQLTALNNGKTKTPRAGCQWSRKYLLSAVSAPTISRQFVLLNGDCLLRTFRTPAATVFQPVPLV